MEARAKRAFGNRLFGSSRTSPASPSTFGEAFVLSFFLIILLLNLILTIKLHVETTIFIYSCPASSPKFTYTKMFSKTARAVSSRALASPLWSTAIPVTRPLSCQLAWPQTRQYHEKVLDRMSLIGCYQHAWMLCPRRWQYG